jgi:hypothetical protein
MNGEKCIRRSPNTLKCDLINSSNSSVTQSDLKKIKEGVCYCKLFEPKSKGIGKDTILNMWTNHCQKWFKEKPTKFLQYVYRYYNKLDFVYKISLINANGFIQAENRMKTILGVEFNKNHLEHIDTRNKDIIDLDIEEYNPPYLPLSKIGEVKEDIAKLIVKADEMLNILGNEKK